MSRFKTVTIFNLTKSKIQLLKETIKLKKTSFPLLFQNWKFAVQLHAYFLCFILNYHNFGRNQYFQILQKVNENSFSLVLLFPVVNYI